MKFFTLSKASEISLNEIIFLSDVSGDDRIFSIADLPLFSLGEVIAIQTKTKEYILEIKDETGVYEVSALPWHKFAVYAPDEIAAKNLNTGDKVLLRGENALPESLLIDSEPMSCISEVLEISKNSPQAVDVTFRLAKPISTRIHFGSFTLPFLRRSSREVSVTLPDYSRVEMSHEG